MAMDSAQDHLTPTYLPVAPPFKQRQAWLQEVLLSTGPWPVDLQVPACVLTTPQVRLSEHAKPPRRPATPPPVMFPMGSQATPKRALQVPRATQLHSGTPSSLPRTPAAQPPVMVKPTPDPDVDEVPVPLRNLVRRTFADRHEVVTDFLVVPAPVEVPVPVDADTPLPGPRPYLSYPGPSPYGRTPRRIPTVSIGWPHLLTKYHALLAAGQTDGMGRVHEDGIPALSSDEDDDDDTDPAYSESPPSVERSTPNSSSHS